MTLHDVAIRDKLNSGGMHNEMPMQLFRNLIYNIFIRLKNWERPVKEVGVAIERLG